MYTQNYTLLSMFLNGDVLFVVPLDDVLNINWHLFRMGKIQLANFQEIKLNVLKTLHCYLCF